MGRKLAIGLILLVLAGGGIGFGYYQSQQGSSASAPAPASSAAGPAAGRYVALGDSYTSSPRTGTPVGSPPGCDRSDNNYPHLVAAEINPAEFADVSCSGATTSNLTGPQTTANGVNPPQLDAVTPETTLVTVGIGGNDLGFIGLVSQCGNQDPNAAPCKNRLTAGGRDLLAERIGATAPKIANVLDRIHEKAPRARVVLVGYPTVLPAGTGCWPFLPLVPADVAYLRDTAARFNDMLETQAKAHEAGYVDTATPSKGHDVCAKAATKWVEDLVPSSPALALHPNAKGEQGIADAVRRLCDSRRDCARQCRSKAILIASASSLSCEDSRKPSCRPRLALGMVWMLSQLTTLSRSRPLAGPTGTSVEMPRTVEVIGATVTRARWGRISSRVRTTTGRTLSRRAVWMGRIRPSRPWVSERNAQPIRRDRPAGRRPAAGFRCRAPR